MLYLIIGLVVLAVCYGGFVKIRNYRNNFFRIMDKYRTDLEKSISTIKDHVDNLKSLNKHKKDPKIDTLISKLEENQRVLSRILDKYSKAESTKS